MRRLVSILASAGVLLLACAGCTPTNPSSGTVRMVVLGDSLSRGYNACGYVGDCPEVSWAGGDDPRVDSVAARVGEALGRQVVVDSIAHSGDVAQDLRHQAALAATADPDLVTLVIGGNDVCRSTSGEMTSTADFAAAIDATLQQLALFAPDAVVLVGSVPDVTALLPAAADDAGARELWSAANSCPTVLADPRSTAADVERRRAAVRARITEYDTVLAGACVAMPRCIYDDGALTEYRPTIDQLSPIDRFHPSLQGLRELAAIEWKALSSSPRADPLRRPR